MGIYPERPKCVIYGQTKEQTDKLIRTAFILFIYKICGVRNAVASGDCSAELEAPK